MPRCNSLHTSVHFEREDATNACHIELTSWSVVSFECSSSTSEGASLTMSADLRMPSPRFNDGVEHEMLIGREKNKSQFIGLHTHSSCSRVHGPESFGIRPFDPSDQIRSFPMSPRTNTANSSVLDNTEMSWSRNSPSSESSYFRALLRRAPSPMTPRKCGSKSTGTANEIVDVVEISTSFS